MSRLSAEFCVEVERIPFVVKVVSHLCDLDPVVDTYFGTPGTIPGHPSQERDRESAGEALEGSYCNPSPPPRPSAHRTGMADGAQLKYATVSQEGRL